MEPSKREGSTLKYIKAGRVTRQIRAGQSMKKAGKEQREEVQRGTRHKGRNTK